MKDAENYKILMKEGRHKQIETTLCSGIERNNTVKMSASPQMIYQFNAICIKIPMRSFTEIKRYHPKIHMEPKERS
jgi:hypothetical protein